MLLIKTNEDSITKHFTATIIHNNKLTKITYARNNTTASSTNVLLNSDDDSDDDANFNSIMLSQDVEKTLDDRIMMFKTFKQSASDESSIVNLKDAKVVLLRLAV